LRERFHEVFAAAKEARRPLLFGQLIIMVVYLPIFALTGVEGKMFHPMAFTVVAAALGAMILSVTFIPAAVALFIGKRVAEKENSPDGDGQERLRAAAGQGDGSTGAHRRRGAGRAVRLAGQPPGQRVRANLNEGDMPIQALRIPGTSLTQSLEMQKQMEAGSRRVPEIERVFARTGTAEIASDPMPPNISDGYIMLKPESAWPSRKRRATADAAIKAEAGKMPASLRVLPADPAALQRADLRRAQRRGGQGLRRRHGRAQRHRQADRRVLQSIPGAPR
jgi:cobalt-zinc-cadmium resistance protein CzcA